MATADGELHLPGSRLPRRADLDGATHLPGREPGRVGGAAGRGGRPSNITEDAVAGTRKFKQSSGEEVEAEVVGFRAVGEHWNEYLLDDGTVFRIKLVVTEIARLKDHFDGKGDPIYAATHTQVTAVDAPERLRGPAD
jgi:hypothetical protein